MELSETQGNRKLLRRQNEKLKEELDHLNQKLAKYAPSILVSLNFMEDISPFIGLLIYQ